MDSRPTKRLVLIRDGTIWGPDGTEIDLRTPDYSVWITVKSDRGGDTEAVADALESMFAAEGATTGHGTGTAESVGSPGEGASSQDEVGGE